MTGPGAALARGTHARLDPSTASDLHAPPAERIDLTPVFEVDGQVLHACQPKQLEALRATPLLPGPSWTHIGYGGAAGAGKSRLARIVAALVAIQWPGSVCGIFRRTYPELRENHIVPFREEVPEFNGKLYRFLKQDKVAEWRNGSRTIFGYLRRDDDVFQYQGLQFDCMIFEEATHYTWFQVMWLTRNRLRANVDGSTPFAMYPTNPGNIGHFWFKRLFIDRNYRGDLNESGTDYHFIQARLEDNPILMDRDPGYVEKLDSLPEPLRSQLRDGDWEAGAGLALPQMRRHVHLVDPFTPPKEWYHWGAFDWGYQHPFFFGLFVTNEDGQVWLVDSVSGRHRHDPEIIEAIQDAFPRERPEDELEMWQRLRTVHAGHDAWHDHVARMQRKETGPNTAEKFQEAGFPFVKASISRKSGLRNLREYTKWQAADDSTTVVVPPRFRIMDTPTNRRVYDCLEGMVVDPDNLEDALKVDADEFGEGGDDAYDMTRMGLMVRPILPKKEEAPDRTRNVDRGLERMMEKMQKERERNRRARGRTG